MVWQADAGVGVKQADHDLLFAPLVQLPNPSCLSLLPNIRSDASRSTGLTRCLAFQTWS